MTVKRDLHTSMYDYVFREFENKKNLIAIDYLHKQFTYERFKNESDLFARAFSSFGLKKDDVITLALPNIPTALSAFYGANRLGIVINLVHPLAPYSQLRDSMQRTNSKLLFSMDVVLDGYFNEVVSDGFTVVCCGVEDWFSFPTSMVVSLFGKRKCKNISKNEKLIKVKDFLRYGEGESSFIEDFSADETRLIMQSGGTSDMPKSIMLTNRNFNAIAHNTIKVVSGEAGKAPTGNKAMIAALPMFHCFGLGVTFHAMLSYNCQVVLIPKYRPKAIVNAIRRNKKVNMISGVPTMFNGIIKEKRFLGGFLRRLEFAFCGGDKLSPVLKREFDSLMKSYGSSCRLDEGYGLTETSGVICVNRRGAECEGSVGRAIGDYVVEAFDLDSNERLERGSVGQLCVSGVTVMKGYLDCDNSTVFFDYEGKRFVKTGDIGIVDSDGFIFIKGRIKRMVKVSGVNVYPAEAEQVICRVEGVSNCCVIAREHQFKGKEMMAFVVANNDINRADLEGEIKKHCQSNLNKWTMPRSIFFVDELPTTLLGKVDVKKLESSHSAFE